MSSMISRRTTKSSQVERCQAEHVDLLICCQCEIHLFSAAMIALSAGKDPDKNQLSKESLASAEDAVKFKILQKAEQRINAASDL